MKCVDAPPTRYVDAPSTDDIARDVIGDALDVNDDVEWRYVPTTSTSSGRTVGNARRTHRSDDAVKRCVLRADLQPNPPRRARWERYITRSH